MAKSLVDPPPSEEERRRHKEVLEATRAMLASRIRALGPDIGLTMVPGMPAEFTVTPLGETVTNWPFVTLREETQAVQDKQVALILDSPTFTDIMEAIGQEASRRALTHTGQFGHNAMHAVHARALAMGIDVWVSVRLAVLGSRTLQLTLTPA